MGEIDMSEARVIAQADLKTIESNLKDIHGRLGSIDAGIDTVDNHVKVVDKHIDRLTQDLHQFIAYQMGRNNVQEAKADLIDIKLELEQKFGKYKTVREHALGILQADDLGIVRKETISTATEELMLATPGYWLAPCLVALAAWISNQQDLADKAVKEGLRRNDEKTSLFFALVCRRANRKDVCLKWAQRYLAGQNEESLDRNAIIILDAYASGLLGADSEGLIAKQIDKWLEHLAEKTGFVEQQREQWSKAILAKREPVDTSSYTYLRRYSPTWPVLEDILEGANLHEHIFDYFANIFEQEATNNSLKEQLDDILHSLVTDFDDEELPLKKRERYNELVIQFEGDKERAKKNLDIEEKLFETHKDFTQLLTEAAMNPEESHASVSTQKFAIALSRDWINEAYNDVIAKNRMKIPHKILIQVDVLDDNTIAGENEEKLLEKYRDLLLDEKKKALEKCVLTGFDTFCLYGGGAIAAMGGIMALTGSKGMGIIAVIAGIGCVIRHFSRKNEIVELKNKIETDFAQRLETGLEVIRAFMAEVVDFREEFTEKDKNSQDVLDFLNQITPEQYVRKLTDSNRKIML